MGRMVRMARMAPIYLDYNATTPLDPKVASRMSELLTACAAGDALDPASCFGNPSSNHIYGTTAKEALENSRSQVARCIGAQSSEQILFTSGGTESINHAIQGVCFAALEKSHKQIITSAIEHVAVEKTIDFLVENFGFEKTVLPVNELGVVSLESVQQALSENTLLVTIMLANNEVGSLQPVREICKIVAEKSKQIGRKILVHTDASQAVGKVSVNATDLGVDLLSIAGHKLYGPKGIGCLFVREDFWKQNLMQSFMHGAGHESGRRAGTENVLLSVGLGKACELVTEGPLLSAVLRDSLETRLLEGCKARQLDCRVNGDPSARLPNTLSISFRGVLSSDLLRLIAPRVSCSAGAACHSNGALHVSHVLAAMQVPEEYALGTLRLSVGRFTTQQDVDSAADSILNALDQLVSDKGAEAEQVPQKRLPDTELEYFGDSYKFSSTATLLDIREKQQQQEEDGHQRFGLVFDRTIFYPQGGGQPSDTGRVEADGAVFHVEFVAKEENLVVHYGYFEGKELGVGVSVKLLVDEAKRRYHARIHSAGHLIDQAMILCGVGLNATKGCHFPSIGPSVDYAGTLGTEERAALKDKLQAKLEELIAQKLPTKVHMVPAKDAAAFCQQGQAPQTDSEESLRVVIVGGDKGCPCGGTHVKSTEEIREIQIRKIANKKGSLRVSYVVPE